MPVTRESDRVDQAVIDNRAPTIAALFTDRVAATPDAEAFRYPEGDGWTSISWAQTAVRVNELAAGLLSLGIGPEDRVAVVSTTRIEWVLADLAIMCAGGATTTVYPTSSAADVLFILGDSQSRVAFVEDENQLAKLRAHRSELPELRTLVLFNGSAADDGVISLDELAIHGRALLDGSPDALARRAAQIGPDNLATLIYTSGTTGRPKGVRLSHSALTYEAATVDSLHTLSSADLQYLWLPLAHVFGKLLLAMPLQIGFATAVDGRIDRIVANLAVVRPTFMGAAPRIFEKVYAGVLATVATESARTQRIFGWATAVGRRAATIRRAGGSIGPTLAAQLAVADRLVLSKIRARFGGRIRFFVSGSAALNTDVAEWFDGVGLKILEGYGLTESSAASFCNRPDRYVIGTVGLAYPGTEVQIAEDGEILLRGPGLMQGYHNLPDQSAEAIDEQGWLHTGDIGELDSEGYLRITDRKKDLFKTSGGKYIAPALIESTFKGVCPLASQLIVHGNNRNYVTALITLDPDAVTAWSAAAGMAGSSYAEAASSPQMRVTMQRYIDELNASLNRWETIKRWDILAHDLTVESGELTPSLKLRRKVVAERYADRFDELYAAAE